jgi:hypothetical protein
MTELPVNVGSYRDRHGKVRWRYRKGEINVPLPGGPGDQDFEYAHQLAASGKLAQSSLSPAVNRGALMRDFTREVLARVKNRSCKKGVPFSLTVDDIKGLMEEQKWRCAVSGIRFMVGKGADSPFQPSLDRIEPSKGYVPGNVRIVCYIVNLAMNKWGEDPLRLLARTMANRWLT